MTFTKESQVVSRLPYNRIRVERRQDAIEMREYRRSRLRSRMDLIRDHLYYHNRIRQLNNAINARQEKMRATMQKISDMENDHPDRADLIGYWYELKDMVNELCDDLFESRRSRDRLPTLPRLRAAETVMFL